MIVFVASLDSLIFRIRTINYYGKGQLGAILAPYTASDIYLGTGLPKRTVIRIIDRLEDLNVVEKKADTNDGRVTRIVFSATFAAEINNHLQECLAEGL